MSDKHYNAEYLQDTGRILRDLKEYSYGPFKSVSGGVIIDLGCGTGADALALAQILGDQVELVGIDHDPAMLKIAEENKGQHNIRFIQSESDKIPFPDGQVSGIRAERLIQHLKDPNRTFQEIYRVLMPGAPVVIVETDWNSLTFFSDQVEIEQKLIRYLTESKVNNGFAAKKTTGYLNGIGLQNIRMEVFPFNLKTLKSANEYLWIGYILKDALEKAVISEPEYNTFNKSLEMADTGNYFNCSINIVIGSGTK